ncbi:MAG: YbjN domain-containing protein [bacterium]
MSVLVEALSLIVPRRVLDIGYPGGTHDFMKRMCEPSVPCRLVCADDQLVSVSFHSVDQAQVVADELRDFGVVGVDDGGFYELALVDQVAGPMMPCDWLEWRRHQDGFTYCWVTGGDPDPMHVPDNWTPAQSRGLTFHDLRDESDRCIKLADETHREIWLDFQTGALFTAPPRPVDAPIDPAPIAAMSEAQPSDEMVEEEGTLASIIRAALDRQQLRYRVVDDHMFDLSITNETGTYPFLIIGNDTTDLVRVQGSLGTRIPEERRLAIAEAIARINLRLVIGNFDLDFADGEVRFRTSMDVEDGVLSTTMVDNMIAFSLFTLDQYHHALMRIALTDVDPAIEIGGVK